MKHSIQFIFAMLLLTSALAAQNKLLLQSTAYVNFNVGSSKIKPQEEYKLQGVTLFGCNTIVSNTNNKYWNKAPNGLVWDTKNQVFTNLPYGKQIDQPTKESYYVSKYYIASPPVFIRGKNGQPDSSTQYDIGIVTPDEFVFDGDKPVQQVYLNYNILELMKIEYIPVVFDSSFDSLMVDIIPFKVECKDFPWLDKTLYNYAKGASGIGSLNRKLPYPEKLFLPYYENNLTPIENKQFLNCEVSILNDILFHREIFFMIDGEKKSSINLKEYYNKHRNDKEMKIKLHCEYRKELACGCKEP